MKKNLIFLLLISLSIISCKKIIESAASLGKEEVKIEELNKININDEYAVSVPDYMTEMKSLHDDASFQYANLFKESIGALDVKKLDSRIKNLPSQIHKFNGKVEGLEIAYVVSLVEAEKKMYMIMSWTIKNRYSKYKETFKLIHSTFKLI